MKKAVRVGCWVGLLAIAMSSCRCGPQVSARSGSVKDDDVEEPLPASLAIYKKHLQTSNAVAELLVAGKIEELMRTHASDSLKDQATPAQIQEGLDRISNAVGEAVSFKPMQWNFQMKTESAIPVLTSTKILHHERGTVYMTCTFIPTDPDEIIGLHFQPRTRSPE